MSSHTITGTWPAGYNVTVATLFNEGTINGPLPSNGIGLYSANSADIINSGTIAPGSLHPAVSLHAGGTLTNQSGGTIGGSNGVSISGGAATVVNASSIKAAATNGVGIHLAGASVGYITNAASGSIAGAVGIDLLAGGTLTNAGTISGSGGTAVAFGGTGNNLVVLEPGARFSGVVRGSASASNELELASASGVGTVSRFGVSFSNFATLSVDPGASWTLDAPNTIGVGKTVLVAGTLANDGSILSTVFVHYGVLSNTSTGFIAGSGTIQPGVDGVFIDFAGLVNAGTVAGVGLGLGAWVTNAGSGVITADRFGYAFEAQSGSVVNYGSITGSIWVTNDLWITNDASGSIYGGISALNGRITNAVSASITGLLDFGFGMNVHNQGTIAGGIHLEENAFGAWVTNSVSASIAGSDGVYVGAGSVYGGTTVVNDGRIYGRGSGFVRYGATVAEGGIGFGASAIGFVSNGSAGSITGTQYGIFGPATVVNDGTIAGTHGDGVSLTAGGAITNAASASITGGNDGVDLSAGGTIGNAGTIRGGRFGVALTAGGTLRNGGTIVGNSGTAVAFGATGSNLLVLQPGAAFFGAIDAGVSASNTLELGSGSSTGTLTSLGSFFTNLTSATIDSGASWTLTDATLWDAGGLVNDGQIALDPSTLFAASLTGTGSVTIDAGSTLIVLGTVAAGETIAFSGIGGVLDLGDPAGMAGTIVGYVSGDVINSGPQTVANTGTIAGTSHYGVFLVTGGLVTNAASASITGSYTGVLILGGAGTVDNDGSIAGTARYGIELRSGGSVTNAASASITGGVDGVRLTAGGTLTNAGMITGTSGTAVYFKGVAPGLLVLDPGYGFSGLVSGSTAASDTLELASAAGAGVLTGLGTEFVNFGHIAFDAGAEWSIAGNASGLAGTISGFAAGDTIEVTGITATGSNYAGGVLTLSTGTGPVTLHLPGTFTAADFVVLNVAGGVDVWRASTVVIDGSSTLTGTYTSTVTLTSASYLDAVTVSATGLLHGGTGDGLDGQSTPGWTVVNQGRIIPLAFGKNGIHLAGGGTIGNEAGATITGQGSGVIIDGGAGLVDNSGRIEGYSSAGVGLLAGGAVTNQSGGTIGGAFGVAISGGAGTVSNAGSIVATAANGIGISLNGTSAGTIINAASGLIAGAVGVELSAGGRLSNGGTINGSGGIAVAFGGTGSNMLVLEPGAAFSGAVDAGANASNALELASGSSTGTLTGLGSFFINLESATIDSGASWELTDATLLDAGGLVNDGQIVLDPSTLLVASLTGTGSVTIDAGSTLTVQGTVGAGETIVFAGVGGVLDLGHSAAMAGTIVGYVSGDIINAGPRTVTNDGTIPGTSRYGVLLGTGGLVTNAASASIAGSYTGVVILGGVGTVANAGSIAGAAKYGVDLHSGGSVTNATSASITGGYSGVKLDGGGSVTNAVSASIAGGVGGVVFSNDAATLYNYGAIGGGTGVRLLAGGAVTNAISGTITGDTGVAFFNDAGTLFNYGSIVGGTYAWYGAGVALNAGGSVTNAASATIHGAFYGVKLDGGGSVTNAVSGLISGDGYTYMDVGRGVDIFNGPGTVVNDGTIVGAMGGVVFPDGGTLTNAGVIVGSGGWTVRYPYGWYRVPEPAVDFGGGGPGLLVLEPGCRFSGIVSGSTSARDTLELASAASVGTLSGLGTEFVNFRSIVLDAGATWTIGGTVTTGETVRFAGTSDLLTLSNPGSVSGTIDGFDYGDTIALAGIANVSSATMNVHNLLTVTRSAGAPITLQFDPLQDFSGAIFHQAVSGSATDITMIPRGVHWAAGSGNFNTVTDWNPQGIPGTTDTVIIDAPGPYTVTASTNETVKTLVVAANARLVVSAGTFSVSNGSVAGGLAGTIVVDAGAALALAGSAVNNGTIAGAGQLGNGGSLSLVNAAGAIIDANQAAALMLKTTGKVSNRGVIESTNTVVGNGGLVVQSTTIDNAGGTVAANGAHTHVDLAGGTLVGGVLTTSSGGVIRTAAGANGVLDGLHDGALTNNGLVRVADSTSLDLLGSIVNTGTINANATTAGNTDLQIGSPVVTLTGGGTVLLSSNAGNRIVGTAAANRLVNSDNTIAGGGQLGAGALAFRNGGTVNANTAVGLTIALGSGHTGQNLAGGLIEAKGAGGLTIASGTVSNAGTMLAANGSKLTFQSGVVNSNNTGGVLSWGTVKWISGLAVGGGTWEADGNGSTLSVTGGAVTIDRAAIILSGAGSVFRAGDGSIFTKLEVSLGGIAPIGVLDLLAGRSFTATHGIADHGMIQLAGGTLTLPRLAVGAGGHVSGFGTIADTRLPVFNGGTIEAQGGTLAIATAIDPTSTGVFQLDASSLLEIAADQGAADKMRFAGAGGELVIDKVEKFGLNVGTAAYTGPLVQNFGSGDQILLKNVAPAGLTPVYDTTTGILQVSNGSANLGSLMFEKATLGTGSFHFGDDGLGHALLTHS